MTLKDLDFSVESTRYCGKYALIVIRIIIIFIIIIIFFFFFFFFFQALNFLVESFGLLNDLFPFLPIPDASYPIFLIFIWQMSCLMLSSHLYLRLPCNLLIMGFPIKYPLNCSGIWHPLYVTKPT